MDYFNRIIFGIFLVIITIPTLILVYSGRVIVTVFFDIIEFRDKMREGFDLEYPTRENRE